MNLRDLQYLVAVADHQHFGRAAAACFVSQPALSMQLQKLEETLGVQLLERTNKKVMVTQVGYEIVERARKVLQTTEEIKDVAQSFQNPFAGTLKLGAFPTLAPYLLPLVVPDIRKALPELKLFLVEEKTEILLNKVQSGALDCALLALPLADEGLHTEILFEDPFLLAVPPQHPLARRKLVTRKDIEGEQLLLLEEGHCLRRQALEVCGMMKVSEYQDFRATSMETLRQMVASGAGMTLIPKLARYDNDGIAYIPFSQHIPSRTIGLVWRKTMAKNLCCEKIAEIIARQVDIA